MNKGYKNYLPFQKVCGKYWVWGFISVRLLGLCEVNWQVTMDSYVSFYFSPSKYSMCSLPFSLWLFQFTIGSLFIFLFLVMSSHQLTIDTSKPYALATPAIGSSVTGVEGTDISIRRDLTQWRRRLVKEVKKWPRTWENIRSLKKVKCLLFSTNLDGPCQF